MAGLRPAWSATGRIARARDGAGLRKERTITVNRPGTAGRRRTALVALPRRPYDTRGVQRALLSTHARVHNHGRRTGTRAAGHDRFEPQAGDLPALATPGRI